ncbi:hypothetical protein EVAR_76082_1 [Eumeta japonica]|uniref:Uncharacterized protein n=1 Tax=Eumeta variegata TaxID=151549 RepID=A0A4C1W6R0_EUMVA|nr:hypothetical protein EVAR_76082_1 [Eumeta japonica]
MGTRITQQSAEWRPTSSGGRQWMIYYWPVQDRAPDATERARIAGEDAQTNTYCYAQQTLKALNKAKKTENGRQMKETCPFPLYLLTHYSIYYLSRIQFLAKGCTKSTGLFTPFTPNPD